MPSMTRRHGLCLLAGSVVTTAALGVRAAARASSGQTMTLVEKNAGRVAFYALPDGKRLGTISLSTQPHEIVADVGGQFAYVGHYGVESWKAPGAGGSRSGS